MEILKSTTSRRLTLIITDIIYYLGILVISISTVLYGYDNRLGNIVLGLAFIASFIQIAVVGKYWSKIFYIISPISEELDEQDERDTYLKSRFLRIYSKLNEFFIFGPVFILAILPVFNISSVFIVVYLVSYKIITDLFYLIYFFYRNLKD